MAQHKATTKAVSKETGAKLQKVHLPLFQKENYVWMAIGGAVIALGMLLMAGGKNENPNQFDYDVVYSTTRITIAPILILLGFAIEIYAIFKKPKAQHSAVK